MKIRITQDVPVEDKHGILKGRVFDAIINPTDIPEHHYIEEIGRDYMGRPIYENKVVRDFYEYFYKGRNFFWVQGDANEAVKIWSRECVVIDEDEYEGADTEAVAGNTTG